MSNLPNLPNLPQFTELTKKINKIFNKKQKKEEGIFFSPKDARDKIFDFLKEIKFSPKTILEPSFGSGEFITDLQNEFPKATIYGIEKNNEIFDNVEKYLKINKKITLINDDFLKTKTEKVEFIVGNPPYFITKIKNEKCMTGRGNIFVLFLYKCLTEHLKDDGILAFILPTSFYNCSYYEPCRKYISKNTKILHLEELDVNFSDTKQETMLLILQKSKVDSSEIKKSNFILDIEGNTYITPNAIKIRNLLKNTTTIEKLHFRVKTGTVVWNQHKDKLTDNKKEGTLLIYNSNISDDKLVINNLLGEEKKQYIKKIDKPKEEGPVILIYRGHGNKFELKYLYLQEDIEFYAENHINVIYPFDESYDEDDIKNIFDKIDQSFKNKKTEEFIKLFVGNGSLSKTELEKILPIYI